MFYNKTGTVFSTVPVLIYISLVVLAVLIRGGACHLLEPS